MYTGGIMICVTTESESLWFWLIGGLSIQLIVYDVRKKITVVE